MLAPIFPDEKILGERSMVNRRGVMAASTHPLAAYSFTAPLMLHRGDNVPVGVYQDRACTIPATKDMDPIRGWRDEILHTPFEAIAPTDENRAFLRIIGGVPCVYFDGVDSWLEITGYPAGSWDSTHLLTARMVRFGTNQYLATNQHANDRDSFIGGFGNDHVRYWNGSSAVAGCGLMDTADFRVYAGVREDTGSSAIYRGYQDGISGETVEVANRYQSGAKWILGAAEDGVTPAEMYVSSWCLRAAKSKEEEIVAVSAFLKSLAPANPLAGLPSLLDLRTHVGDKIPLGIHSDEDASNIRWGGFTGSGTQAVETKQPLTKFTSDGTPYLDFDGVDDWMSLGLMPGSITYSCLIRSKTTTWNSFWSVIESIGASPGRFGAIAEEGQTYLHSNPYPVSIRRNGVILSSPFDCAPLDEWTVFTIVTQTGSPGEVGIFQLDGTQFGNAQGIALFVHDGIPTEERVETVEAYFQTLKPVS